MSIKPLSSCARARPRVPDTNTQGNPHPVLADRHMRTRACFLKRHESTVTEVGAMDVKGIEAEAFSCGDIT